MCVGRGHLGNKRQKQLHKIILTQSLWVLQGLGLPWGWGTLGRALTCPLSPSAQQCIAENENATRSAAPGRVLGVLGRWLENLPTALYPRPMEEATASPTFSWDCPGP